MAFPTIHTCVICEFARQELGNKTILLGFYGASPDVRVSVRNFNQPVQLCLVFCGGRGEGHFKFETKITAPNGQEFDLLPIEGDLSPQGSVSNLFMGFQLTLPGPGIYKATLLADGIPIYEAQFSLGQMPNGGLPTSPQRPRIQ